MTWAAVQPPFDDQQIDHPAHPNCDPDRLPNGRRIILNTSKDFRHKDGEGNHQPKPVGHDGEGQGNAPQHPGPVVGIAPLPDCSEAGQRRAEPQHRQHRAATR
jgi:hypothetical protein